MLSKKTDKLSADLRLFGLSDDEVTVYLILCERGFSTAVAISRASSLGRTKIYRILDSLYAKKIVQYQLSDRGLKFGVSTPHDLQRIIHAKEQEIHSMKHTFPELLAELDQIRSSGPTPSQVLYYRGKTGLEQVTYNSTKARGLLRIYESGQTMESFLDKKTAEDMRARFVENHVKTHQLTNFAQIGAFTAIEEFIQHHWEVRFVPPGKMTFEYEVLMYNDVYAMYQVRDDEVFCVEICDESLARMQKQLFDYVWESAQQMQKTSLTGEAQIENVTLCSRS